MGKISQVSSKYIVHASIDIEGIVDKPDVIGAIFGQTEGLLGADLELRELQRSGRIGRIEVNVDTKGGKSQGSILVPSSLDKAETSIIAAALEIIQRIGPCNAKIKVINIEDVRISKRRYVIERAKELLAKMMDGVIPDSQELAEEVAHSIRVMEIQAFGQERLPAGPAIADSDEIIIVEGRADVLTLLKNGFKNAIAMNGTSVPNTIKDLLNKKEITVFVDGDRGGDLIIKELLAVGEIDFITKAPDGKEVEELTKKEIHKALRSKIAAEQVKLEYTEAKEVLRQRPSFERRPAPRRPMQRPVQRPVQRSTRPMPSRVRSDDLKKLEKDKIKPMLEGLVGTRGACILDEKLNVLGKVPTSELGSTVRSLNGEVYALVFDGSVNKDMIDIAEKSRIRHLIGMDSQVNSQDTKVNIVIAEEL